ncbi:hypothetical protein IFM89_017407 [Coptis chinensis]|uniref:Uncharacterized protein n=1 Tax=Coptis chinensis TaxID=261450 RepID=A0A835LQK1_9MAGN|nr:hypothetical protein IFM89_017407 [Coptis chinensis]
MKVAENFCQPENFKGLVSWLILLN